ncbi:electron transfer flavoprotein subunit alpha/FixB family protein [Paenibacillus sp. J2TS4]|uniref:electron transfer flavoprotein subunit alpha/FixB family protein n=1 Tax=Paenibacillus sp. J2TS4 TaxID=2807194 RepID=UPI001B2097F8|nr:electron transfer flavoprotein subunit alpha/FixB family protein [Paenibacillus sp. J2TS4]GIP32754.1 electron transfer flavoprotein subunit alpha [Paenibacillus sp. J2TS4]
MERSVLVLAEAKEGKLRHVTFEALAAARRLSEGGRIRTALFGQDLRPLIPDLALHGSDQVYLVEHECLNRYTPDGYTQALAELIAHDDPDVILVPHTAIGKDLAPRTAARLGCGLISDCTDVECEDGEIVFTRPIYAGKAFEKRKFVSGKVFATLRPNNIPAEEMETSRECEEIPYSVEIKDLRTIVKEVVTRSLTGVDLSEAKIVVSGGRGVKSAEGFQPLRELADVLGAAVGASRGACDAGYCDYSLQIGQTGKVITPDLYIACGISGAIQHLAGMSNSKVIVAINKDPEAPIFQIADYGIVGDLFEVVPLLTERFKEMLAE